MKKLVATFLMLFVSSLYSQITLIPDSQFEGYLIALGIDSDEEVNGQIFTSDIEDIISFAFLGNPLITDLTGIEDFTSLENLEIYSVNITDIDLSNNLNLKRLDIADVSLISLDLSNNTLLEEFDLSLNFNGGFFTSPITFIDLSSNTLLRNTNISQTLITDIDFSQNMNLEVMELIDMNELINVNINNDNNQNFIWVRILSNDNLLCVQVDDPAAVIAGVDPPYDNWIINNDDPIITDDCQLGVTDNILADNISIYPNPASSRLTINSTSTSQIKSINIYDVLGRLVLQEKEQFKSIDVPHLKSGLLFVTIETAEGTVTKKVVKE